MNNMNTYLNKINNEREKNKNMKERLMRKKPEKEQRFVQIMTGKTASRDFIKDMMNRYKSSIFLLDRPPQLSFIPGWGIMDGFLLKRVVDSFESTIRVKNEIMITNSEEFPYNEEDNEDNKELYIQQILKKEERLDDTLSQIYVSIFNDDDMERISLLFSNIRKTIEEYNTELPVMKLVNIYKPFYIFNKKASGWGDFIRGSYFLMQFCEEKGIVFDMDMSQHMISKYLKKYTTINKMKDCYNPKNINNNTTKIRNKNVITTKIYNRVVKFEETNFLPNISEQNIILSEHKNIEEIYNMCIAYINSQNFYCDYNEYSNHSDNNDNNDMEDIYYTSKSIIKKYVYNPINTKYVYIGTFPFNTITDEQKERMKKEIEPTDEINKKVHIILKNIGFFGQEFFVLHIRCGDDYLLDGVSYFSQDFLIKVYNEIRQWIGFLLQKRLNINIINTNTKMYGGSVSQLKETIEKKVIITADNNDIKRYIIKEFPYFKTFFLDITHFGEGQILEEQKVQNTIIEFYIMSKSKCIFSLSTYQHGSGFSKWCADTYSIPYVCKYISN